MKTGMFMVIRTGSTRLPGKALPVTSISCMKGKLSKLEADIDDIYQMVLEFNGGAIGSMHTVSSKEWKQYPQEKGRVVEAYVMEDDMYVEEMRHFVGAIEGKHQYMYSLEDDQKILELLYAAKKSSTDQIHVETK
jgi:hypothetical protein